MSQGDREAFEYMYRQYVDRLYGFVFGLLKSAIQTQDVVQEVFIAVWEHRHTIDPNLSFKAYLFTIAHRRVLNEFRKQVNQPHFSDYMDYIDALPSSDDPVFRAIDFDIFRDQLKKAKTMLTDRQRNIFELHVEKGFSVAEIAEEFLINQQSVRNSLAISRSILKKELETYKPLLLWIVLSSSFFNQ